MTRPKPRLRPHPLAELYEAAERAYREASRELEDLRARLARVDRELEELTGGLARELGPGYLTVKTVKGGNGRRYRYPVWRRLGESDVYLSGDPRAARILELRREKRSLEARISKVKRVGRWAQAQMKAAKDYADVCIDESSGEYTSCTGTR